MKITVAGHASTNFGELWHKSLSDLLHEASFKAINNANLEEKDIEAIFVANKAAGSFEGQLHLGAMVSELFPHQPPAMRIEGACASGGLAVLAAEYALLAGQYKTVLVVGAEKMTDVSSEESTQVLAGAADLEKERGSTFPGLYALLAQAHMQKFGTTREMLSAVAVKNHLHAFDNEHAHFHKQFTLEQISQSALVADPLRLLDCSPISDGAAAVILTSKSLPTGKKNKAKILAFGHAQDSLTLAGRSSLTELLATKKAASQAYQMAGLKPNDIQVAKVHDCFTIAEILAIEDLGFFKKGEGGRATLAGKTSKNNKNSQIIINPYGGLKACGHPVGATGVKQIAYLAEILESKNYQFALAHNVGGSGATAVVHILGI